MPKGDLLLKIESVAFLNLPLLVIFEEEWILNSVQWQRIVRSSLDWWKGFKNTIVFILHNYSALHYIVKSTMIVTLTISKLKLQRLDRNYLVNNSTHTFLATKITSRVVIKVSNVKRVFCGVVMWRSYYKCLFWDLKLMQLSTTWLDRI